MIDVNQQKFWMLSSKTHFAFEDQCEVLEWNDSRNVLRFRSSRTVEDLPADRDISKKLANQPPVTFDAFGTWAKVKVNRTQSTIIAGGVFPDEIEVYTLPDKEKVADMAMNADGVLYVISKNEQDKSTVYCINCRGSKEEGKGGYIGYDEDQYDIKRDNKLFPESGGQPDRLVALAQGGALLLDRKSKNFWQVVGEPVRDQPTAVYSPQTPRPCEDGPEKQKLINRPDLKLPESYDVIDMASNPNGEVAVLLYPPEPDKPAAVVLIVDKKISAPVPLHGALAPFSIGWVRGGQWALLFEYNGVEKGEFNNEVLVTRLLDEKILEAIGDEHICFNDVIKGKDRLRKRLEQLKINEIETVLALWQKDHKRRKCTIAYPIPFKKQVNSDTTVEPIIASGHRYPINWGCEKKNKNKKFCNGLSQPGFYQSTDSKGNFLLRHLHPLSFPDYPTQAEIDAVQIIDSGEPNTIWHRLYLEAHLPKGTGVIVHLAAGEDEQKLQYRPEWMEHHFGAVPSAPNIPRGAWIRDASEVPFCSGLLNCRPEPNHTGVFTALVQRSGYAVRNLKGRYLKVKIELNGEGYSSPEVAALRIYYPRFSYLDNYLPELYRETKFREDAKEKGDASASGADFLQRFLCLFESVLTPMEDKIAAVHMLTNPMSTPAEALDWLGQWISMSEENDLPEQRKRHYIRKATELYRKRGTMNGLKLALDIATGYMVQSGHIFLLEDFRLRRTFATILGAELSVENDPLLMGDIPSANSFIGDALILGEEEKKEFLALYSGDIPTSMVEQEVIDHFYARLANRLTVLVHHHTSEEEMGLIRQVVSMEAPSHIEFRVVPASKPLLIGLYSLVGVDTYLQKEPERRFARVGHSYLGRYDFIKKLPVLDDRVEP